MDPIRVIVIDDSAFMRKMISHILTSDKRIRVIARARNGEDGLKKIEELSPDVVTLDVEMPVMNGLTTLEKILENNPLPVVMLSGVTNKDAAKVVQAMAIGAVDFIAKPSGEISLDINKIEREITTKVINAAEAKVSKTNLSQNKNKKVIRLQKHTKTVVAIGTSTGGPRALQRVLTDLGNDFSPPILIVQHMPARFTKSLAERLNAITALHVKEAIHGEITQDHTVYIAPGNYHMETRAVEKGIAIELTQDPLIHGHRPAVDVLFGSIANLKDTNKIAIILTGMGRDGSKGIKQIKKKDTKAIAIAEAKESTIINGMPAAAIKTNCVDQIIHLHKVGETITNLVNKSGRF